MRRRNPSSTNILLVLIIICLGLLYWLSQTDANQTVVHSTDTIPLDNATLNRPGDLQPAPGSNLQPADPVKPGDLGNVSL